VFVVGHLGDWRRAAAVLFERESLRGNPPPRREPGQGAAPTISARPTGGGGLGTDFDLDGGLIAADVAPTLNAHFGDKQGLEDQHINGGGGMFVAHTLCGEGFDASEDGCGRGTPIVPVAFDMAQITSKANRTRVEAGLPASTLNAAGQMHVAQPIAFAQNQRDELRLMNVAGALASEPGMKQQTYLHTGWRVRRLTPTECERLQGFPDSYTNIPYRNKNDAPDGPRYKALGNSMAVNAMRWIGRRIEMVDALETTP
jgi:DNA (cytosine-5)-methyltransferase 1